MKGTTASGMAAMALLIGTPVGASAQTPQSIEPLVPAQGTVLEVTAEGHTTRVPDLATIRAGVVSQAATATAALADNAGRMTRVLDALRKAGVAPRDLATANVTLQPQYRYVENQPPQLTGYQANNSVSVRFRDVARSGAILDALVAQGANQIDGPNLSIDNPDAALDEARTDAVKRARARAELYARAAGMGVQRIVSISEAGQDDGDGGRPPVMMMARADVRPKTEIVPGEKDVSVTLAVRFLLR